MRISDWSSDVCSSDLAVERAGGGRIEGVDRQRRFARARDAGDAGEGAERELRIDIPEVVGARALDGEVLARDGKSVVSGKSVSVSVDLGVRRLITKQKALLLNNKLF